MLRAVDLLADPPEGQGGGREEASAVVFVDLRVVREEALEYFWKVEEKVSCVSGMASWSIQAQHGEYPPPFLLFSSFLLPRSIVLLVGRWLKVFFFFLLDS